MWALVTVVTWKMNQVKFQLMILANNNKFINTFVKMRIIIQNKYKKYKYQKNIQLKIFCKVQITHTNKNTY